MKQLFQPVTNPFLLVISLSLLNISLPLLMTTTGITGPQWGMVFYARCCSIYFIFKFKTNRKRRDAKQLLMLLVLA
jgi:Ca2+/Na+ antiporter